MISTRRIFWLREARLYPDILHESIDICCRASHYKKVQRDNLFTPKAPFFLAKNVRFSPLVDLG